MASDHSSRAASKASRNGSEQVREVGRRQFLASTAMAVGGLLLGDAAGPRRARAQSGLAAPAAMTVKFTDWGWPQPYEQISAK